MTRSKKQALNALVLTKSNLKGQLEYQEEGRRMTPRSQLIFDKSNLVRSITEECRNHFHTLKLKNSEVIIIKASEI